MNNIPAFYLTNEEYQRLERLLTELATLVDRIYCQDIPTQQAPNLN